MLLVLRALIEFIHYDLLHAMGGFQKVYSSVRRTPTVVTSHRHEVVARVTSAVTLAACFYWRPVLCLQRSMVTTRLLRRYGEPAELVIGYRPSPFFSHAWVELGGRVVNDSPVFQERLLVLDRF
jgi:hypothetical protein